MAEETTNTSTTSKKTEKAEKTTRFSEADQANLMSALRAGTKEARDEALKKESSRNILLSLHEAEGSLYPLPGRVDHKLSLNPFYSWGKTVVGVGATIMVGKKIWDGGKWLKDYFIPA